jgi:RNA polymerase sigma-70 factor (ECF subfamily)
MLMDHDADLVRRTLEGRSEAFGALVEKYQRLVHGLAFHLVGNLTDAEDLVQDAFVRAYQNLHCLDDPMKFAGWLRRIIANECKMQLRRKRSKEIQANVDEAGKVTLDMSLLEDPSPRPDEALEKKELRQEVMRAVESLSEGTRLTVTMFYLNGMSYQEVSDFLEVPISTVKTRLHKARNKLKEELWKMVEQEFAEKRLGSEFTQKVLEKVETVRTAPTILWSLYPCMRALGEAWSLSYLMGIDGYAFRLAVDEQISGYHSHVLDWDRVWEVPKRAGYEVRGIGATLYNPDWKVSPEEFEAKKEEAWEQVRRVIDRGVPVIVWQPMTVQQKEEGLQAYEFGIIYGYDTSTQEYLIKHPWAGEFAVPYKGIGHTDPVNWFQVTWFEKKTPVDPKELERHGLTFAVEHARRTPPNDAIGWGLGGYEMWRRALETGRIGPDGGGDMATMVQECRRHAVAFLDEIGDHFGSGAHVHLDRARSLYQTVVDAWEAYLKVFPNPWTSSPPSRGDVGNPEDRHRGLSALNRAYEAERKAVEEIEAALREIEGHS